jgi:Domain of unknown function (DUF6362)
MSRLHIRNGVSHEGFGPTNGPSRANQPDYQFRFSLYPPVSPGRHGANGAHDSRPNGARNGASNGALNGARRDAEYVIYRLEEAGQTLLALPNTGYSTRLRTSSIDIVRSALEGYGWENFRKDDHRLRPALPDSARITRMDEALGWIPHIPQDRYVLRRIVGARALVSPVTERHLFTWRRLATLLGADHKAVQRWHAQGVAMIVAALAG